MHASQLKLKISLSILISTKHMFLKKAERFAIQLCEIQLHGRLKHNKNEAILSIIKLK